MADQENCKVHSIVISSIDEKYKAILEQLTSINCKLDNATERMIASEVKIKHLEDSDKVQWAFINEINRTVYKAVGMAAVSASILSWIIQHYLKLGC